MADTATTGFYQPNQQYVGYSPNDLRYGNQFGENGSGFGGDPNLLAKALGISADTKLQANPYTLAGLPESDISEFLRKGFSQTTATAGQESALGASKGITEQAYAERQRQLEAEKAPLAERYQGLIDELTRRENKETNQQSIALAQEYGKRGVPLSSGVYNQDLMNKTQDISQFYGGQQKDVTFEREDKLREISNLLSNLPIDKAKELNAIDQQIAQLKASGLNQQLELQLQAVRDSREEYWKQQEMDLQKQQFEFQTKPQPTNPLDDAYKQAQIANIYSTINNRGQSSSGAGQLPDLNDIFG